MIKERLTRLERKNRRLTLALVSVGTAAILAVAVGMAASEAVPDEVKARKFTLVDANGKVRAMLTVDKSGTGVSLLDENGKPRATLTVLNTVPDLSLLDENGRVSGSLP